MTTSPDDAARVAAIREHPELASDLDVEWLLEQLAEASRELAKFRNGYFESRLDGAALRAELAAAEARIEAALALCDADDEASLRPAPTDFEPIEVPWTVAVRAALAVSGQEEQRDTALDGLMRYMGAPPPPGQHYVVGQEDEQP